MVQTCLDKVASPTTKAPLSFKRLNLATDVIGQSPFRTPPSLSCRPDKVIDFLCRKMGACMFLFLDRVMLLVSFYFFYFFTKWVFRCSFSLLTVALGILF